ncbi:MAG: LysR family transcriptional regulator [Actinomycetota bacterium]|nr:LysR family transcriptional regulator [Actinomycetota bacterium]
MDIQTLRAFVAVADCGTVTGAARGMGYSQPGLSQRLQCLERVVGCPLFSRDSGRMRLTTQGRTLLPYARMIVVLSDEMRREVPAAAAAARGPVGAVSSASGVRHTNSL